MATSPAVSLNSVVAAPVTAPVGPREDAQFPLPWGVVVRESVLAWGWSRLALLAVTYCSLLLLQPTHAQGGQVVAPARVSLHDMLARWMLWDGGSYLHSARSNYPQSIDAAFFPLYPLLVRLAHVTGGGPSDFSWVVAGLVVSNLTALGGLVAIGLLAYQEYGSLLGGRLATRVLLAYPLAFFLAATYTDGLFLALAAVALLAARRRVWWLAALAAFLAGLARPTAVILVLPLLWEWARATRASRWHGLRHGRWGEGVALALAVPLALGCYALYCWQHFSDPLAFVHAQAVFGIQPRWPWQTAALVWTQLYMSGLGSWQGARTLVDAVPVLLLAGVTIAGSRSRPLSFTLYLAGLVLLCLMSPIIVSQFPDALAGGGRFVLAAVPLWLQAGRALARWPWLETPLVTGAALLQGLLVAFVLTGGWLI